MKLSDQELTRMVRNAPIAKDFNVLLDAYVAGRSVLDVGCIHYYGQPSFGVIHREVLKRCHRCVGIDISEDILRLTPHDESVRYYHADAERFVLDERFDTIFARDVIEHLSNPGLFLSNAIRMMHRESDLVITTPNVAGFRYLVTAAVGLQPTVAPEHTNFFSFSTLNELLSRFQLRLTALYYIAGQQLSGNESSKWRLYRRFYRATLTLPKMKKHADTIAVVARLDRDVSPS